MTDSDPDSKELRKIPPVHELLNKVAVCSWAVSYSADQISAAVREELDSVRTRVMEQRGAVPEIEALLESIHARLAASVAFSLRKVINATGIIVHTNLGRAPLAPEALRHLSHIAGGYSNLEFDLDEGTRGSRETHLEGFLTRLLGCESSLVVNNNASALMLMLNTFAEGKEVIVSRGELVEIGGSFRLPEIMKKSQAVLREVGTTNKTRLQDYRAAINERTGLILLVHPSNYQIIGFTEKPDPAEVIALGAETGVPVMEDHGSGVLVDLAEAGIPDEPSVRLRLDLGFEAVCFSGDKILGGPQAGIACGKRSRIEAMRKNPLFRALRVDKMVYAALEATLRLYLMGRTQNIPVLRMLSQTVDQLRRRAGAWVHELQSQLPEAGLEIVESACYVGGGVAPMKSLDSCAVALRHTSVSSQQISAALRKSYPPIVARIEDDRVLFEMRTLEAEDLPVITEALFEILAP